MRPLVPQARTDDHRLHELEGAGALLPHPDHQGLRENKEEGLILPLTPSSPDHLKAPTRRRIKMRKGQQQIRCSSDVSIAGRTDNRLQKRGLHPQKMRRPREQQEGRVPGMVRSGGGAVVHRLLEDDTGIPHRGKDVLHLRYADVAPRLLLGVADLPLLLKDAGLLPHHPVVDLHPPDDILPLSNAATALHLCPLRRGNCLTHQ